MSSLRQSQLRPALSGKPLNAQGPRKLKIFEDVENDTQGDTTISGGKGMLSMTAGMGKGFDRSEGDKKFRELDKVMKAMQRKGDQLARRVDTLDDRVSTIQGDIVDLHTGMDITRSTSPNPAADSSVSLQKQALIHTPLKANHTPIAPADHPAPSGTPLKQLGDLNHITQAESPPVPALQKRLKRMSLHGIGMMGHERVHLASELKNEVVLEEEEEVENGMDASSEEGGMTKAIVIHDTPGSVTREEVSAAQAPMCEEIEIEIEPEQGASISGDMKKGAGGPECQEPIVEPTCGDVEGLVGYEPGDITLSDPLGDLFRKTSIERDRATVLRHTQQISEILVRLSAIEALTSSPPKGHAGRTIVDPFEELWRLESALRQKAEVALAIAEDKIAVLEHQHTNREVIEMAHVPFHGRGGKAVSTSTSYRVSLLLLGCLAVIIAIVSSRSSI